MHRLNIAVLGCTTKSRADGQGWQQLQSSDFNPSPWLCQNPQSRTFHLLVQFMQGIPKKPAEQDVQLIFTIQPCQHSCFFSNKLGGINLLLAKRTSARFFHLKYTLIGSALQLFKQQYVMKTNRCITVRCHCKIVHVCHQQVLIGKLKKTITFELWQGNQVAIEVQLPQPQSSQQRGAPLHGPSRCPWARTHTQLPHVGCSYSPTPTHPTACSCPLIAHPHHHCCRGSHFSADSTENPLKWVGEKKTLPIT